MDNDEQRDYSEESYNRNMCPLCDHSPCMSGKGKGRCCCDLYRQTGSLHNNMCLDQ